MEVYKLFNASYYSYEVDAEIEEAEIKEVELPSGKVVKGYPVGSLGRGRWLSVLRANHVPEDGTLIIINAPMGYRGGNSIEVKGKHEILAEGKIADGDAGRMGNGRQIIIHVPDGENVEIEVKVSGRRYGKPTSYTFNCVGGQPPELTADNSCTII